jgi:hypothetical protein
MAFQLPPLPNFNTSIPAMPSAVDQMAKVASLKNMLSENALRQQLAPLNVQEAQQRVQQETTQNQLAQLKFSSLQAKIKAWSDPDFAANITGGDNKAATAAVGFNPGFDPFRMIKGLVSRGVQPDDAMADAASFLELSKNLSLKTKDDLSNYKESHEQVANVFAPVLDMKASEAGPAFAAAKQKAASIPGLDPQDAKYILQSDLEHVPALIAHLGIAGKLADFHKGQAEAASAGTTAVKGQLETAAPSTTQLQTFTTKTVPSFASLRPEQKSAFITEAQGARTVAELNQVIERADSTDKAEQMHADSLAQTKALSGQHFQQKGIEDNDKTWTDPQHGFVTVASQVKLAKQALKEGADGSGLAASLGPVMTVLGINSFNQMHRISPAEAQAAAMPGGYAERFNAWADKAFTGKLSPQVAREGTQLMDDILDQAHGRALQSSQMKVRSFGIPANQMPVMDREGNVTTLDKVAAKPTTAPKAAQPPGATHTAMGSDGKLHWTDAAGTKDFGVKH